MVPTKQRWRWVVGYPDYAVSSRGRVLSFRRKDKKYLTACPTTKGYMGLRLFSYLGKGRWFSVHRLVALAFVPNPDALPEVNHKDGDKANNAAENLEWATHLDNLLHASRTGLLRPVRGVIHHNAKLNEVKVAKIRRLYATGGYSQAVLGEKFGVHQSIISDIVRHKIWKDLREGV